MTQNQKTRAESTPTSMKPVSRLVRPIVKGLLPKNAILLQQLFDAWGDLMKGTEAEGAIPEKLTFLRGEQNKGKLYLCTLTSAQAMEIQFSQRALLQRINAFFGCETVAEIRVTAYPTATTSRQESPRQVVKSTPTMTCQSLDKDMAGISNPSLRAILAEFGSLLHSTDKGNDHA